MVEPPETAFQAGQIHKKRNGSDSLVQLVRRVEPPLGYFGAVWWRVVDVMLGYEYDCSQRSLGWETYNAMEVIAWASR